MLLIEGVLASEDIDRVRDKLAGLPFRDGKATAGAEARKVKANRQAMGADPGVQALAEFVGRALSRHELFMSYARPAKWSPIMFNRYGAGESYGLHMDDALMGEGEARLRTDLSYTLFLTDPGAYEGGELVMSGIDGERAVKGAAGSVVIYATGLPHRVEAVTAGERTAAVGWIQSEVRRADQREILFDLARLRGVTLEGEARLTLDKSIGNLVRMWGEP